MMRETACRFGRGRHLVGIMGVPAQARTETGVILLNAGMVHRIGPFRLHVDLTRHLNALGFATLRFDLSTLGDSGASGGGLTRTQQVCADASDAMNLLASGSGCTQFVLVGLCSGAQNVHTVAVNDPRVVGAVFLDGYAYRTWGYALRRYAPRLLDLSRWRRRFARSGAPAATGESEAVFAVAPLPRAQVVADFTALVARGTRLLLVYSGGISEFFNHRRQFRECFGRVMKHPLVTTSFVAEADHTYILAGDRERLVRDVGAWMTRGFPASTHRSAA